MREESIREIESLPQLLDSLLGGTSEGDLDTPYREGGWTARQVIHHLADSHMNGFIRMKMILTEGQPTLKTYEQDAWALLPDSKEPVGVSLELLRALHARWVLLLRQLPDEAWQRSGLHPEDGRVTVESLAGVYAKHGRDHLAHIRAGIAAARR